MDWDDMNGQDDGL